MRAIRGLSFVQVEVFLQEHSEAGVLPDQENGVKKFCTKEAELGKRLFDSFTLAAVQLYLLTIL